MTTLAPTAPAIRRTDPDCGEPAPRARDGATFLASLGGVPLHRVIFDPPPGTVTAAYYEAVDGRVDGVLVELVNKTLVEKTMGADESRIGSNVLGFIWNHVRHAKLGFVMMADGMVRMAGGNRRMPDVAVYLKTDYPGGRRPKEKVSSLPPRLAVEVLSEDNTAAEIDMKLTEYFAAGCRLAYVIDPATRTARRHTAAREFAEIPADGELDGGDVLPGFAVALAELFDEGEEE